MSRPKGSKNLKHKSDSVTINTKDGEIKIETHEELKELPTKEEALAEIRKE